jgi:hypothetical protein
MKRSVLTAIALVGCLVSLYATGGCGLFDGFGGTGTLRVLVTDKPYPYEFITEALVTVTRVDVHQVEDGDDGNANDNTGDAGNTNENDNVSEGDDDDGSWLTVFQGEETFNLLELRNGRTDLLALADLPAGQYNQMRVVVTAGQVTLTDGRVFPLNVPSGEQTGIKLHFTFEVADGEESVLLLDVDLSRAFSAIPSGHIDDVSTITEFRFSPSVAMKLIDMLEAGQITGVVTDADGNPVEAAAVTAYKDDQEYTSTATEADGTYTLGGLPTGTYRVEFSASGLVESETTGVEVQAGQTTADVNASLQTAPQ